MILQWLACLAVMAGTYCGVLADPDPLPTAHEVVLAEPASVTAAEQRIVDYAAVQTYLEHLDARTLIEIAWAGTGQTSKALAIANRESHFNCSAKNPHSSASGVFQTLSLHRARAERLGLAWSDVTGPSCYADVVLAFDIWRDSGWGPWRVR